MKVTKIVGICTFIRVRIERRMFDKVHESREIPPAGRRRLVQGESTNLIVLDDS